MIATGVEVAYSQIWRATPILCANPVAISSNVRVPLCPPSNLVSHHASTHIVPHINFNGSRLATNFGRMKNDPNKQRKVAVQYVELCGLRNGEKLSHNDKADKLPISSWFRGR